MPYPCQPLMQCPSPVNLQVGDSYAYHAKTLVFIDALNCLSVNQVSLALDFSHTLTNDMSLISLVDPIDGDAPILSIANFNIYKDYIEKLIVNQNGLAASMTALICVDSVVTTTSDPLIHSPIITPTMQSFHAIESTQSTQDKINLLFENARKLIVNQELMDHNACTKICLPNGGGGTGVCASTVITVTGGLTETVTVLAPPLERFWKLQGHQTHSTAPSSKCVFAVIKLNDASGDTILNPPYLGFNHTNKDPAPAFDGNPLTDGYVGNTSILPRVGFIAKGDMDGTNNPTELFVTMQNDPWSPTYSTPAENALQYADFAIGTPTLTIENHNGWVHVHSTGNYTWTAPPQESRTIAIPSGSLPAPNRVVYTPSSATAIDPVDGDISANLVITNPVDLYTAGVYNVIYSITNACGATVTATKVVTVS